MSESNGGFEELLDFLKRTRGFDFTGYKRPSLMRRFLKRMQTIGLEDFTAYHDHLQVHPEEFTDLFNTILINVTGFFRDPQIWSSIETEIIPALLGNKTPDKTLRVWSAGTASGEEAYSIAMLLAEAMGRKAFQKDVKIYGTDVDDEALVQARQGSYSEKSVEAVPPALRNKYFRHQNGAWVFDKDLRRSLIFGRHDLVQDAPISRVDLLLCRNVLMYFNADTQAKVMSNLYFAVRDGGYVVLGKAEMLSSRLRYFQPVDMKRRVFVKPAGEAPPDALILLAQAGSDDAAGEIADQIHKREAAFQAGPLAQIVIDKRGLLVLANEAARSLFGLRGGDLGSPFHELELSYRPVDLRTPIDEVSRTKVPVGIPDVSMKARGGEVTSDIEIVPLLEETGSMLGVSITFRDVSRYKELQEELEQSNQELETAMEELQSTNEELETTNEELQSTNEELETMNEELQSTNEELSTVNEEMRDRTEELDQVNAFLRSVLAGVRAGVVVVDDEMRVTVWNHVSHDLWGLRFEEVAGRSLLGLDIGLKVDGLKPMIRACLDGVSELEDETFDALNRRGQSIRCRVTCAPLRGNDGTIRGAILFMETLNEPNG